LGDGETASAVVASKIIVECRRVIARVVLVDAEDSARPPSRR
jgi:hypothetical protein